MYTGMVQAMELRVKESGDASLAGTLSGYPCVFCSCLDARKVPLFSVYSSLFLVLPLSPTPSTEKLEKARAESAAGLEGLHHNRVQKEQEMREQVPRARARGTRSY